MLSDLTRTSHTNLIKESLSVSARQIKETEGKLEKIQAQYATSEIKKIYLPSVNLFSFPPLNDFMQTAPREHAARSTAEAALQKQQCCASRDRDETKTYVVPSLPSLLSSYKVAPPLLLVLRKRWLTVSNFDCRSINQ